MHSEKAVPSEEHTIVPGVQVSAPMVSLSGRKLGLGVATGVDVRVAPTVVVAD
jgi:hypothetical protein